MQNANDQCENAPGVNFAGLDPVSRARCQQVYPNCGPVFPNPQQPLPIAFLHQIQQANPVGLQNEQQGGKRKNRRNTKKNMPKLKRKSTRNNRK